MEIDYLLRNFGPYAFGALILLLIWKQIVQPVLQMNKTDAQVILQTAQANAKTAECLARALEEINQIVQKLPKEWKQKE